jgi:NAD+ synthase (glutamine-hydrolysing)
MQDATADIDLERLLSGRMKTNTFEHHEDSSFQWIPFSLPLSAPKKILRHYSRNPFIPESRTIDLKRVQTILDIQAMGLVKRLKTVHQEKAIIGLSGGLDSTLALLVTVEAFKKAGYDRKGILALTLPAFGTSQRTHKNAKLLAEELGVSFDEINIKESLNVHFKDISHDPNDHNVAYENAQARERTQVLMDIANDRGYLMVGTGDLSELCLGWCTYNGDHMSMYGVNAGVPKTLIRYLVTYVAGEMATDTLLDIIDTPISPELIPADKNGKIKQKTEDLVGPYELHDFFLYYFLRFGFRPQKIYVLAQKAFDKTYNDATIKKWLTTFCRRFFTQQFKRSCLPDGPKVGTVSLSPRGDWRMPSDASYTLWIKECENL